MTPTSSAGSSNNSNNSQDNLQQHSGAARSPSDQSRTETSRLQNIERSDRQESGLLERQPTEPMPSAPLAQANVTALNVTNLGQEERPAIAPQHRQVDDAQSFLTDWVNNGPDNEKTERQECMRRLLEAEATLSPDGTLSVDGTLDLCGFTSLTSLPDNLSVAQGLYACDCTSLTSLSGNLYVGGYLNLSGCTNLTSLPDNLRVGTHLFLGDCPSLNSLPNNLHVGESLIVVRCASLTSLPDNLYVGRHLNLSDCASLTSLPSWIARLGRTVFNSIREIDITNTGISENVFNQLQDTLDSNDIRVIFGHAPTPTPANESQSLNAGLNAALAIWGINPGSENYGRLLEAIPPNSHQSRSLSTYLARLEDTADARNVQARAILKRRIQGMIRGIVENNNGFRDTALSIITAGLTSCDDRTIQALNNIDVSLAVRDAEVSEEPRQKLTELAKSLFARQCIHERAAELAARPGFVDPVEVYLALEISLRDEFNLPGKTQGMIFRGCANISDHDIESVRRFTRERVNNGELLGEYLVNFDPLVRLDYSGSGKRDNVLR